MFVTPSYPWDDYRLLSLGYWPLLEQWLRRVAQYPNVYSFAQYNVLTDEAVSAKMKYWNDPLHFSMTMGRLMLRAFSGERDVGLPKNFMVALNPQTVEAVIENRRAGLDRWTTENQGFVALFEAAKRAGRLGPLGEVQAGRSITRCILGALGTVFEGWFFAGTTGSIDNGTLMSSNKLVTSDFITTSPRFASQGGWSAGYALARGTGRASWSGPGRDNPNVFAADLLAPSGQTVPDCRESLEREPDASRCIRSNQLASARPAILFLSD